MLAVKFLGNGDVDVVDVSRPETKTGWVTVKIRASAICGSDLPGYFSAEGCAFIPGHEVAGEVFEVGEGVVRIKAKDRVAINCMLSCGTCEYCRRGDWIFCSELKVIGFQIDGGYAEYLAVPERNCFLLPGDLSFEQGALLGDVVGTPFRAIQRLGVNGLHTVALFGLGPVGLGTLLILKLLNCKVISVEINEYRRKMGRSLGADVVINPGKQDVTAMIEDWTGGRGVDVALDCAGKEVTENQALDCVKKRGKVAFLGQNKSATINPSAQFIRKELTVIGSLYFNAGEYEELIALVRQGLILERIITHRFSLKEAQEAFSLFASGQTGKGIFLP